MRRILSSRWAPQNDIISEESRLILKIAPVSTNAELLNGIIYLVLICIYIAKTKKLIQMFSSGCGLPRRVNGLPDILILFWS